MKTQIIICFDNGKWLSDYIYIPKEQNPKEAMNEYMHKYDEVCKNDMEIIGKLLPAIIHISVVED